MTTAAIRGFVHALRSYDQSFDGVRRLVRAADQVGLPELRRASLELQRLTPSRGDQGVRLRFAASAPKKIYPDRAAMLGRLLSDLNKSPNAQVREFARELGLAWFRQEAVPHGIRGKDFYG